jgi:hypothetical protein
MHELTTTANLVEGILNGGSPVAVLSRDELAAALETGEPTQLWLEIGREDAEDVRLVSLDVTRGDLEKMLSRSTGDDVLLALDGYALHGLFDDPDVEAHGLRGALAVAVVAGAIAAPSSIAATPQATTAASPQLSSAAAQAQVSSTAARGQAMPAASRAQVSQVQSIRGKARGQVSKTQVSKTQVSAQVSKAQASRAQLSRTLVVRASGLRWTGRPLSG